MPRVPAPVGLFRAEFELGEYRNLEVIYNEPVVADEELDARLAEIREDKAQFVNEDPRPAQAGDFAVVDLERCELGTCLTSDEGEWPTLREA